jgi:hypothetical protein
MLNKIMKVKPNQTKSKIYQTLYIFAFILITQTTSKIVMKTGNIKKFTKLSKEDPEFYFNYQEGQWIEFDSYHTKNNDSRIFEFHPSNKGFLDYYNGPKITGQTLFTGKNALVFYKDKNPIVKESYKERISGKVRSFQEVENKVGKYLELNESFLDYMNNFPYFTMSLSYYSNTNLLLDFPNKLRKSSDVDDISQIYNQYNLEMPQNVTNQLIMKFSLLIYTFYITKDLRSFTDPDYINDIRKNNFLWTDNYDDFYSDLQEELKNTEESGTILQTFKNLIDEIQYFAHKCFRIYFFHDQIPFLGDLFIFFRENESTFSDLFQKNMHNIKGQNILQTDIINYIEPEFGFDINFIDHEANGNESVIRERLGELFKIKLEKISSYINEIMVFLHPTLHDLFGTEQQTVDFKEIKFLNSLLYIYSFDFGNNLFAHYASIVHDGLLKMPELVSNSIKDMDKPAEFAEFRKRMVILGYVNFDWNIDLEKLFYKNYKAFKFVKDGRILV